MTHSHVIVGGGISGLVAALYLSASQPSERVVLVEREPSIGGLLRSVDGGEFGRFDLGMHNMYETGIKDLDALLFELLPESEWQLLEGAKRDLAGLYFNGTLQRHSLFPDLRNLPRTSLEDCVADFFLNLNSSPEEDHSSAAAFIASRLGKNIFEQVVAPILRKLFKQDPQKLDVMATMLTSLTRVVLFDEKPFLDLMASESLRTRIAFPEQRNLPLGFSSGKRGYYPVKYGMYRVVDAIRQRLEKAGVKILTSTDVVSFKTGERTIESVTLRNQRGDMQIISSPLNLYWTVGLPLLARHLGIEGIKPPPDRPLETVVINFLLDRPIDMGDLYYFYCYDEGFNTFRVTNYSSYCAGAIRNNGYPICVEFLIKPEVALSLDALVDAAWKELLQFGVLAPGTRRVYAKADSLSSGFPMPTLENTAALDQIRSAVIALNIDNLVTTGILSEPGIFFQRDVLVHTYQKIAHRSQI